MVEIHKETLEQSELREWATDTSSFPKDETDYSEHVQRKLPRLYDEVLPSSLRECAFLGPSMQTFTNGWKPDGVARGAELERVEASLYS